jgi:hypothetical protein
MGDQIITFATFNTWLLYAITYDGTNGRLYLDGVLQRTTPTVYGSTGDSLNIGSFNRQINNSNWIGSWDDCRIFNTALDATDVADLYAAGRGGQA